MAISFLGSNKRKKVVRKKGGNLINTLINKLPFELHLPGYNYCGPGTKLSKRLARGDKGVNLLDEACKKHDIVYSASKDIKSRHLADDLLAQKAFERFRAKDASVGEKIAALGITGAMKVKTKLGMGIRRKKRRGRKMKNPKGGKISLSKAISLAKTVMRGKKFKGLNTAAKFALASIKKKGKVSPIKNRVIPIPKSGGFLPLIPLFAGLSALGALGGGAAGIAKAVTDAKAAQRKLEEDKRHNKTMEDIALGKKGSGLYLKPYKSGCGLYLKPYSKNC